MLARPRLGQRHLQAPEGCQRRQCSWQAAALSSLSPCERLASSRTTHQPSRLPHRLGLNFDNCGFCEFLPTGQTFGLNCWREPISRSRSNGSKSPSRTAGSESSACLAFIEVERAASDAIAGGREDAESSTSTSWRTRSASSRTARSSLAMHRWRSEARSGSIQAIGEWRLRPVVYRRSAFCGARKLPGLRGLGCATRPFWAGTRDLRRRRLHLTHPTPEPRPRPRSTVHGPILHCDHRACCALGSSRQYYGWGR